MSIKMIIKILILFVIEFFSVFLSFSFFNYSFDAGTWDWIDRALMIFIFWMVAAFTVIHLSQEKFNE